ncbi:MAG: TonB-dependent receptor [Bacteroidia bacterium]|nr:TonB-dependent receptor [Bacteroidia bacterium]
MKRTLSLVLLFIPLFLFSQSQSISGTLTDGQTGDPLGFARVSVRETGAGTYSDAGGNFEFQVDFGERESMTLEISYLGYNTETLNITRSSGKIVLALRPEDVMGKEVVITGSRVSETILESPVNIQKISAAEIANTPSGDFYQGIGNLSGVDMVTSSLGLKSVNMRGFNTTSPVRSVQFIDGVDNQAPGLNFPVGNLVGASDLDLQSVELITGAASALYGPNAFQGVIAMTTKDPYLYQGISAQVKGGTRSLGDVHLRAAKAFGPSQKFAFKFTGSYMRANDWPATDSVANRYGDVESEQDLSAIIRQLQYDSTLTQEERDDFEALNNYLDFNPIANPGKMTIQAPGYREADIADYTTRSMKMGLGFYYKFNDSLRISYDYRVGNGTAVYQGTNRYSINNILFQQHKLELTGKDFFVRAYSTQENAGKSYDIVFTAINLSKEGFPNYIGDYISEYFSVIDTLTHGFNDDAKQWMVDSAHHAASLFAADSWYKPGTKAFDSLYQKITTNPDLQKGSKFVDRSNLQHIEAQYNLPLKFTDFIVGGNARRYDPQSYGTIFRDTLINPGDTLPNGQNDPDAAYSQISLIEFGAYLQATKRLLQDRLRISASVRFDKNPNFNLQMSPRLSAVYSWKGGNQNIRVAAQSAFRTPTLQNQYIQLNLGPIKLLGNLTGYDNLYTLTSLEDFNDTYDSTLVIDPSILQTVVLDPLKPEQVRSIEAGYRGVFNNKLFVDVSGYYSVYTNFIGNIRVVRPLGEAVAGEESGVNAILTHTPDQPTYELYQIPVNASQAVASYGGSVGLSYYFGKGITGLFNYTLSLLDTSNLNDPIVPGFNTPPHKFNLGLQGRKVWRELGFGFNFKYVSKYRWESSFGDGDVPSYALFDAMVSYGFPKWHSILRLGGSNIFNNRHIEAYGSPKIGAMGWISWTVDIQDWKLK